MKKIFTVVFVLMCLFLVGSLSHAETLYSKVVTTFDSAITTINPTGLVFSSDTVKMRIKAITISWAVTSSTASIILYDNIRGLVSKATKIYEVYIPSGTVGPNYITQTYDIALPKIADYGLVAVCTNNGLLAAVTVEYW